MHACLMRIKKAEDISYFGNKEVFCALIVLKKPPVVTSDFVNSLSERIQMDTLVSLFNNLDFMAVMIEYFMTIFRYQDQVLNPAA